MNENNSLKIHDIKDIVEIPDYSIFIFYLLVFLGLIIILLLIIFIIKLFKNKKKNERKEYFKILKNIDYENPKDAAYTITKYSRLLSLNDREKKLSSELIEELEKYKYKKNINKIDQSIKVKLSTYMDVIDV